MPCTRTYRRYDLEDRTLAFAKSVIGLVSSLPKTTSNFEIAKQLIRAAGSVGANYIEANEALGRKDFLMKLRISKKESKESRYWLQLVVCDVETEALRKELVQESTELMLILGAMLRNSAG